MKHIIAQPFHMTIRQYRLAGWMCLVFLGYMLLKAWTFYEVEHTDMGVESAAAFFAFMAALLGAFVKSSNSMREKHED